MNSLTKLYRAILASLSVEADEDGLLSFVHGDNAVPITVDDRRLALPTREILNAGSSAVVPFHPLSEASNRGESKVLQKYLGLIKLRLSSVLMVLTSELVQLAANQDGHKRLDPHASLLLSTMPEADKRSVEDMQKILDACEEDSSKLLKIFLKRGGHYRGKKMTRVAVVNFPFMADFENDDGKVLGVKLRKKDFAGFQKFFQYLLPHINDAEGYNAGSMSMAAPYLDALTQAFVKIAKDLNAVTTVQRKYLDDSDSLLIDLSWEDDVRDWSHYRDEIPPLTDSMGALMDGNVATDQTKVSNTAASPFPNRPVESNTHHAVKPSAGLPYPNEEVATPAAPATDSGIKSIDDILAAARRGWQPPAAAAPVGYAPAAPVYGAPVGYPGYPGQQPVMAAPPGEYPGYHRGVPIQPAYGQPVGYPGGYGAQPVMSGAQAETAAMANAYAAPAPVYGQPVGYPPQGYAQPVYPGQPAPAFAGGYPGQPRPFI